MQQDAKQANQAGETWRFQAEALAQVDDAVVVIDSQQHIVYLNRKAAAQYEVEPAGALGRLLSDLHQHLWLDPADEAAAGRSLSQQGSWRGQNVHVLPSGKQLHVESTVTLLKNSAGEPLGTMAVIRDVTAEKQAAATLRALQEWQQLALEGARLGTWATDLESDITLWDARCREIFGVGADEPASSEKGFAIIHPEDRARAQQAFLEATKPTSSGIYEVEKRVIWPDGSIHWIATRGRVFFGEQNGERTAQRLAGVAIDISERKQMEQALHETQERFRLALETAPLVIAHLDKEIRYTWLYNAHPDFQAEDMVGKHDDEMLNGHEAEIYIQARRQVLASGIGMRQEFSFTLSDGRHIYDITIEPMRDADGVVSGLTTAALDITERKLAEEEMRSSAEQLRQLMQELQELNDTLEQRVVERTAELERSNSELERSNLELDRFAYVASHDLKSPLRAIDNLANWIAQDVAQQLPPQSQIHLAKLRSRVKRLENLLDDLLLYSRAGRRRYRAETVNTTEVTAGVVEMLNLPSGFSVVIEGSLPSLRSELPPLETVLRNLIGNAAKHHHNPSTGVVTIAAQDRDAFVEFRVNDNGPGIDPQYHERIFGVFQTLKSRDEVEGSGMGLAIVKKTVESAGGQVWLESSPGDGAIFYFTWPKSAQSDEGDDASLT